MRTPMSRYFFTAGWILSTSVTVFSRHLQRVERALADVDARLDDEGHAGLQRPRTFPDVVHVDADVVVRPVRVPHAVLVAAGVGNQAELQQAGLDDLHGLVVHLAQRRAGARHLHRLFLRLQDDGVDVFLVLREGAADRVGPGDVAGHVFVVRRGVDEEQFAGLHLPVVLVVVQDRGVGTARDD